MSLFDHEKLKVDQEAIRFVTWSNDLLEDIPRSVAVHNQLDRASTSVALNIAEGNGTLRRPVQVLRHRPSVCVVVCGVPRCLDSEKEDRVADSRLW